MTNQLTQAFGGPGRLERLREHFRRVNRQSNMYIISFGSQLVIHRILQLVGLDQFFPRNQIITVDISKKSKDANIEDLKRQLSFSRNQVLCVDDNKLTRDQEIARQTCVTMSVPNNNGMEEHEMREIEAKVGFTKF